MAVRGTFDLSSRPAEEALKRIQREGERTEVTMRKLGSAVDETFSSKNVAEAKTYEEQIGKDRKEVELLAADLKALGSIDARPRVNVRGLDEALLKTELLLTRLRAIDGKSVAPNLGLGGLPAAAAARGGGGGGSSFGAGGIRVPLAGRVPYALIAGGLAAAPPLIGGAGALLGSAGSATLGLGALGATGFGVGAAAGGLAAPTSIVAGKQMAESSDALKKFREEVLQTGPASKASMEALRVYRQSLEGAPRGTGQFLRSRTQLGEEFGRATRPGQASVARIATRGVNLGRQLTPELGGLSNRFLGEAQAQTDQFANFLADPQSRDFYKAMSREATADLSNVEGISENVLRTMENIARAGRPFFHEGMVFLEGWTGGWKKSTNDLRSTREEIGGFVDDLKAWGKLGGAGFDLVGDLLGAGRKPGTNMVVDLTNQLQEWDQWVERNPRKVKTFFNDAVEGTGKIAGALGDISQMLWRIGQNLTPLLEQGTQLVGLLDNTGLLTPGGLPFLLAGGAGVRNASRGFGTRMTGGGAGMAAAPLLLGGGGGASRGGFSKTFDRGTYNLARDFGRGRAASTVAGLGAGGSGERAAAFGRGFVGRFGPLLALSAGLGFASTPGNWQERLQGSASQLTFGAIAPPPTADDRFRGGFETGRANASFRGYYNRHRGLTPGPGMEGIRGTAVGSTSRLLRHALAAGDDPEFQGQAAFYRQQLAAIQESLLGRAQGKVGDIREALGVNLRHGVSGARRQAVGAVGTQIGNTRNAGAAQLLGEQGLGLARELVKENPKLKGAVGNLSETIEERLEQLGRKVRVINGNIVDVSAKSWSQVADAAATESQRAYAAANKNLTALEKRAVTILRNMGFSPGVARQLAQQSTMGGEASHLAGRAANADHASAEVNGHLDPHYLPGRRHGKATGGYLAGSGLHDTVNLGGGNFAAPGETLIANRHTERRIDRLLAGAGTTLAREIGMEGRSHSEPFRRFAATGSISPAAKLAQSMGLSVGEGPGFGGVPSSGHASGSLHYSGLAYDVSGAAGAMLRYRKAAEQRFMGHGLNELFYDPYPYYIDAGHKVPGAIGDHSDHVHIGFFPGGAKGMGRMGNRGRAKGHPQIQLQGLKSGVGGLAGAIADKSNQAVAGGMSRNLNRLVAGRGGGGGMPGGVGGNPRKNMALARSMLGHYGWGMGEWDDLKALWQQESRWSQTARNPSSGAYGIPQSLPASKMGPDAQGGGPAAARAQIQWGLKYIQERYGSPSAAWGFHQGHNWYDRGGRVPGMAGWFKNGGHFRVKNPTMFGAGEGGVAEDVHITPMGRGRKGGGGDGITVPVTIGTVYARDPHEARTVGRNIAKGIAAELAGALSASDGVSDKDVD